ncbi:MAG: helix-turn-helix transcriptional regulator [Candidatus Nitronauta litoralis]|uniref:Helix-turn-helix transcriptional regulator n=1 Tax=Candidatus Nitronauta litoralis TaxID=2705533 RepID=A0A7T0BXN1_9BACT|nr:MAG: helix-turn-helix transcriptional regulator [Candidatus Nitronauta litoralis]
MTILSRNMKVIRNNLNCTQTAFAQVLGIGFRTYVRYESGERDVPAATLVKISSLGNVSLDRLLTTPLDSEELNQPDTLIPPNKPEKLYVISGSLPEGRLMVKGYRDDFLITVNSREKKILNHFRKLPPKTREKCLRDVETLSLDSQTIPANKKKRASSKAVKRKNTSKLKKLARSIKKITIK